jgi:hypothetical protein
MASGSTSSKGGVSNSSPLSSSWDKCIQFQLPSSRNFIREHPSSYIANLHSDTTKIGPSWTKITTTPWEGRARLCGGYGRRLCVSLWMSMYEYFMTESVTYHIKDMCLYVWRTNVLVGSRAHRYRMMLRRASLTRKSCLFQLTESTMQLHL